MNGKDRAKLVDAEFRRWRNNPRNRGKLCDVAFVLLLKAHGLSVSDYFKYSE